MLKPTPDFNLNLTNQNNIFCLVSFFEIEIVDKLKEKKTEALF